MRVLQISLFLLVLCLMRGVSVAQESRATLEGRVTDPHGAVVPQASIEVIAEETGVKQHATSSNDGSWSVRFLNPGTYSVSISAPNFKTFEQKGITLEVADDKRLNSVLHVGSKSEIVTVTEEAPLIDTSSATSGTVIDSKTISELPMESRITYLLAGLSPGVHLQNQNNNVVYMWSITGASEILVNGGRDKRSNEFLLDGMPNQTGERVAFIPPADSVNEFRVMTNAYDAQYGREAGGTFNVSLKSGTDAYHGSLYEYHQNFSFNANRYEFNQTTPKTPRPVAHYNLYGGTFGGPVQIPWLYKRKDKTFFFLNWEGIRNRDPRNNAPRSVPTAAERTGDFRNSFTSHVLGNGTRMIDPIKLYDPLSSDPSNRTPFVASSNPSDARYNPVCLAPALTCTNVIPVSRMSPIAKNILKYVPMPNATDPTGSGSSANNFVNTATRNNKMAALVLRVDHNFNDRHKIFGTLRWNHEDEFLDDYFNNISTGGFGTRINRGAGIDHVWTISPTKLLDVRYNITRFEDPGRSHSAGFNPAQLGFSQDFVSKMLQYSFPRITGVFSDVMGGGFGSYTDTTYQTWTASMTQTHGKMTWHYGGDFRVIQEANGDYGHQSGAFRFTSDWTRLKYNTNTGNGDGSAFASFLLGLVSNTGTNLPSEFNRNATRFDSQHFYSLFFQNDWRMTPRLTLNMGLRWDYETPFTERFDRFASVFDPTQLNPISDAAQAKYSQILNTMLASTDARVKSLGQTVAQLVPASSYKIYGVQLFPGVNGQKRTVTNLDLHEWQPRVGFAYQLFKSTVIHGGVGRFVQGTAIKGGRNGFNRTTSIISSTDSGKTTYDTLDNPFKGGILEPTGSSLGPLTSLGQGPSWVNQDPHRPYSWQYSFQIQQELKSWLFEVGYSHQNTYGILSAPGGLEQNDIGFQNWLNYRTPIFDSTGNPQFGPGGLDIGNMYHFGNNLSDDRIPNPFKGLSTNGVQCLNVIPLPDTCVSGGRGTSDTISVYDLLRPLRLYGGLSRGDNPAGKTHYDALETKVQRRFRGGYSVLASYTYSKLIEITAFYPDNQITGRQEHKVGGEDTPHKLSVSSVYELPIGRGKKLFSGMPRVVDYALGGWELTGQYTLQSGPPVVFGTNSFFDGKDPALHGKDPTLAQWFDTSHFYKFPNSGDDITQWPAWTHVQDLPGGHCQPAGSAKNCVYADFANFVRTYPTRWSDVRASRVNEMNFGIYKNFRLTERWKAQLRGEAFNLFNHPRFPGPETNPGNNRFGLVTAAQQNEPRVIHLALKITF